MARQQREHSMGNGGVCVCPKCNANMPHKRGVPCQEEHCPECGAKMLRVGSRHHELWLRKKSS